MGTPLSRRWFLAATGGVCAAGTLPGIARAQEEVRTIARGLVPKLSQGGLADAFRELALRTEEVGGVRCVLACPDDIEVQDEAVANHLYRIAQEAVTNCLKHAEANNILITLGDDGVLQITDDGVGIRAGAELGDGLGLKTMQYRAHLIGARLEIRPLDGGGTALTCKLPQEQRIRTC